MAISLLESETLKFWDRLIVGAKVTINGEERDYPITKTLIEANQLKKYVYLQMETGKITQARLIDVNGREIRSKKMNIQKGDNGLMITFFLSVRIEEGTTNG